MRLRSGKKEQRGTTAATAEGQQGTGTGREDDGGGIEAGTRR